MDIDSHYYFELFKDLLEYLCLMLGKRSCTTVFLAALVTRLRYYPEIRRKVSVDINSCDTTSTYKSISIHILPYTLPSLLIFIVQLIPICIDKRIKNKQPLL